MPEPLDNPFYYLVNFREVVAAVRDRYADLLTAEELQFLQGFSGLSTEAQALLVRLVMRKGKLFRLSKLRYSEIGTVEPVAAELQAAGWLAADPLLTLDELSGLVTRQECHALFAAQLSSPALTKARMVGELRSRHGGRLARPSEWCPALADSIYRLEVREFCDTLRLLYFGNLRQDWSEFVLRDLGMFVYEKVEQATADRPFRQRADIDLYKTVFRCREALEQGTAPPDRLARNVAGLRTDSTWLSQRLARLRFQIARALERAGVCDAALTFYAEIAWPEARIRQARILERRGDHTAAWKVVQQVITAPLSGAESQLARRMAQRLARRVGEAIERPSRQSQHEQFLLTLPFSSEHRVEAAALHRLSSATPAFYVENALISALFGLLCWEAIFAPLPGAFFHPFQAGPADLHQPDFVTRRRERFDACLARLNDGSHEGAICERYRQKRGIQNPFVWWGAIDEALLELALRCIPADHLRVWFAYLLEDLKENRSGLPDLIQFFVPTRTYRLIEVKGPGDRLQDNQKRWLEVFARHQHPVAVCHVQWETSPDQHAMALSG